MDESEELKTIPESYAGQRFDVVLTELLPEYSRSRLQQWVNEGRILLDGRQVRPREKVIGNEAVSIDIAVSEEETSCEPQNIPLSIVYEDEVLIVVDKPAGLVVHPAAGNPSGTLQNALLFHDDRLAQVPRAGIVHRLDKDTTGLLVIARDIRTHKYLVDLLQARKMKREYRAVVHGVMTAGNTVDAPIGRHPRDRKRMAVRDDGKPSVTHYRVLERFREHTYIQLELESGRTHQIRVHMQHIKHPVVGDPVYAGRRKVPADASEAFLDTLRAFDRQALHAFRLTLEHPQTGESMRWEAPLPDDFTALLSALEEDRVAHEDIGDRWG